MRQLNRHWLLAVVALVTLSATSGCVARSKYNDMVEQRDALEASLRAEINSDQVKIDELENGIRVRMSNDLLYVSGSVELHAKGRAALGKVAKQLGTMASEGYEVDVVGNTDNVPVGERLAERYPSNWELAGARAALVVRYLQEQGVDPTKLQAVSAGQYHPVAPNDTVEGRARNRRTEILLRPH